MGLMCGAAISKYLLCFFNFIFFASGAVVLAIGIWLALDSSSFLLLTRLSENEKLLEFNQPSVMEQGAYVLIAAGGLVFLLGFLGCCGAAMESRPLLVTYGVLIILIFMLQVAAGILAAIYKTETEKQLQGFLLMTLSKYYSTQTTANSVTVAWNALMAEIQCCGVNNYTDFSTAEKWQFNKTSNMVIPYACCKLQGDVSNFIPLDPNCVSRPTLENSYYLTGCYGQLLTFLQDHLNILMGIGIGIGVLELVAMLFAFCLCSSIGKKNKYRE